MLQKIHSEGDRVVAFRWDGKYDKEAFIQSMQEFLPELRSRDKMNIYVEMFALEGVELAAVWEDIKFSVKNFKEITDKIEKIALVTDKDWIRNLAGASAKAVPGIHLKSYTFAESDRAILWVNEK